jgi:hypothetical protein
LEYKLETNGCINTTSTFETKFETKKNKKIAKDESIIFETKLDSQFWNTNSNFDFQIHGGFHLSNDIYILLK